MKEETLCKNGWRISLSPYLNGYVVEVRRFGKVGKAYFRFERPRAELIYESLCRRCNYSPAIIRKRAIKNEWFLN